MVRPEDQALLLEAGWMWPAYIQTRAVWRVLKELEQASPGDRRKVIDQALPRIYGPEHLATAYLELYNRIPIVSEFSTSIGESIEAAMLGRHAAAIATLVPVVEGILRRLGEANGRNPRTNQNRLAKELDHAVAFELARSYDKQTTDERIAMIQGFQRFFVEQLFKDTRKGAPVELNRHDISHALTTGWGKETNFYVLISIVEQLAFIICMRTDGAPVLFPSDTSASQILALYYHVLRKVGKTRPTARSAKPTLALGSMATSVPTAPKGR